MNVKIPNFLMHDFFNALKYKEFRRRFIKALRQCPYEEYYLEFPVTTYRTASSTDFDLRIRKAPLSLSRNGEPNDKQTFDFSECGGRKAIGFLSQSGRSYLVVPCPSKNKKKQYDSGHIGQFMRNAKIEYIHALWKKIGQVFFSYFRYRCNKKFKLLTDGRDVFWLHAKFRFE